MPQNKIFVLIIDSWGGMEKHKACSFIGHRKIKVTDCEKSYLTQVIENLIVNHNVGVFLFGSKSDFDTLCHITVTKLKEKYPHLIRIMYTCKSELCILEGERRKCEELYSGVSDRKAALLGYEKEFEFKTKYKAGRASYVERNQAMIESSDYCIFYYDEGYVPDINTQGYRRAKSGTRIAYQYALQRKKAVFNIKNKLNYG